MDKDWEISAVARGNFQSVPEDKRCALLFENVKGFDIPVVLSVLGSSRAIYALALRVRSVEDIGDAWTRALHNPIAPEIARSAPVQEEVHLGLGLGDAEEYPGQAQKAMFGAWAVDPTPGKFTVVVDDDIDVRDAFMVNWALRFRVQPHKDILIAPNTARILAYGSFCSPPHAAKARFGVGFEWISKLSRQLAPRVTGSLRTTGNPSGGSIAAGPHCAGAPGPPCCRAEPQAGFPGPRAASRISAPRLAAR